jgi:beta-glucosidase
MCSSNGRIRRFPLGVWLVTVLTCAAMAAAEPATVPATRPRPDPTVPIPKANDARFDQMHQEFVKRAADGSPMELLFQGDSITAFWLTRAPDLFHQRYDRYHAADFGIPGDHTENVLWRIENGELDHIAPKVLVLMIGTNNTGVNTAEEITAGDVKLVKEIRARLPGTKLLLLGIFPRGPHTAPNGISDNGVAKNKIIRAVNAELAKLDNGDTIRYLDLTTKFVADGKIPDDVMPDQLHPSPKGYQIWADAMQALLDEMMK